MENLFAWSCFHIEEDYVMIATSIFDMHLLASGMHFSRQEEIQSRSDKKEVFCICCFWLLCDCFQPPFQFPPSFPLLKDPFRVECSGLNTLYCVGPLVGLLVTYFHFRRFPVRRSFPTARDWYCRVYGLVFITIDGWHYSALPAADFIILQTRSIVMFDVLSECVSNLSKSDPDRRFGVGSFLKNNPVLTLRSEQIHCLQTLMDQSGKLYHLFEFNRIFLNLFQITMIPVILAYRSQ